jgi:ComF family protein
LEPWEGAICANCGLPLAAEHLEGSATALCSDCRLERLGFDFARVYALYRGPLRQLILRLKFGHRERIGERLGALLAGVWVRNPRYLSLKSPVLVPVPLHPSRQRERGFNQSFAVARGLGRRLRAASPDGIQPVSSGLLVRARPTAPQTGLSIQKRRENVKGVFSVPDPRRVRDRDVVLIDDVMTTGATLSSCANALKSVGARAVLALAVARSTPQFPDLKDHAVAPDIDDQPREWT